MEAHLACVFGHEMFLDVFGCTEAFATVWTVVWVFASVSVEVLPEAALTGKSRSTILMWAVVNATLKQV